MIRNEKGFTLIEALIGSLILGMIILVWSSLEVFTSQVVKKASDFSIGQKVILSIVNDVLTSEKGLPPIEPPSTLKKFKLTRTDLESAFRDLEASSLLRKICYDQKSNLITESAKLKDCYYNVAYLKYRLDDQNYETNREMQQIPLSRMLIRMTYLDPDHAPNFQPNSKDKRELTRYLTRLVSNVAEF